MTVKIPVDLSVVRKIKTVSSGMDIIPVLVSKEKDSGLIRHVIFVSHDIYTILKFMNEQVIIEIYIAFAKNPCHKIRTRIDWRMKFKTENFFQRKTKVKDPDFHLWKTSNDLKTSSFQGNFFPRFSSLLSCWLSFYEERKSLADIHSRNILTFNSE